MSELKLDDIDKQIKALQDERRRLAQEQGRPLIRSRVEELFTFPNVAEINWTQYTPYFNDGEPCTFGIGQAFVKFSTGAEGGDEYRQDYGYDEWDLNYHYEQGKFQFLSKEQLDALRDELGSFESWLNDHEDFVYDVFGDHVRVLISSTGIEVEDYDHD